MSNVIDTILVPTDGSDGALTGARRGIDLAATLGADIHALSVIDTRDIDPVLSSMDTPERRERETLIEADAQQAVDDVAEIAREHLTGEVTTAVERGIPFETISEYVDAHGIDLVVMGTHGRTGLDRVLLGSVAEKTLRTTTVPVVTVPPSADVFEVGQTMYDDVLLPTDGSEGATVAVDWGIEFAAACDATVHTVYSVDTSWFPGVDKVASIHNALERTGEEALKNVRERAGTAGVSAVGHLGTGPAARLILSYCEEHDVDLIVMGTHGRSGFDRFFLGSVTETVVRNADVPVCCVPMMDP